MVDRAPRHPPPRRPALLRAARPRADLRRQHPGVRQRQRPPRHAEPYSRVVRYVVDDSSPDPADWTARQPGRSAPPTSTTGGRLYADFLGDADEQPNGNVLVDAGGINQTEPPARGRILEVVPHDRSGGDIVFDLSLPDTWTSYRGERLPSLYRGTPLGRGLTEHGNRRDRRTSSGAPRALLSPSVATLRIRGRSCRIPTASASRVPRSGAGCLGRADSATERGLPDTERQLSDPTHPSPTTVSVPTPGRGRRRGPRRDGCRSGTTTGARGRCRSGDAGRGRGPRRGPRPTGPAGAVRRRDRVRRRR